MATQSNYAPFTSQTPGHAGQICDNSRHDTTTLFWESESDLIPGIGVVSGTHEDMAKLPTTNTDRFLGVAVTTTATGSGISFSISSPQSSVYHQSQPISVMREGRCYVIVNEGVNKFDPAILQVVSHGEKNVGSFGKTANGVNTLAVNASFRSTASKGEIAILEILRKDII